MSAFCTANTPFCYYKQSWIRKLIPGSLVKINIPVQPCFNIVLFLLPNEYHELTIKKNRTEAPHRMFELSVTDKNVINFWTNIIFCKNVSVFVISPINSEYCVSINECLLRCTIP